MEENKQYVPTGQYSQNGPGEVQTDSPNIRSITLLQSIGVINQKRMDILPFVILTASIVILGITHGLWLWYFIPVIAGLAILMQFICIWSVSIKAKLQFILVKRNKMKEANFVKVIPPPHCGSSEIVPLQHLETGKIFFKFQKLEYIYDDSEARFKELQYPLDLTIGEYVASKGMETSQELELQYDKFGYNLLDIPLPKFLELFKEHATAPFFVFQVFCVILWMLDEYWMYSLFTLLMFVIFEALLVMRRIKSLQDVRNMRARPTQIYVYRLGKWESILTTHLLPGDIVSVTRTPDTGVVPADLLLLFGSCVVNESLLTGESVPQIKEPASNFDSRDQLSMHNVHKASVIFGGTKVELHSYGKSRIKAAPDGGAIAYVLRTGFATNQGNLIRTILFATERVSVNNAESFVFILVLLVFAIAASSYVLYHGLQDPDRSRYKLLLNCIMIITSVVPPELPMELSLAVNNSLAELMKKKIFCTEPFRIPFAGGVQFCCFDKTGTLTADDFILKGVSFGARDDTKDDGLQNLETINSKDTKVVIGGCHSLVKIGEQVVGDPLEKIAFQNLKWNLVGDGLVKSFNHKEELRIIHRYPFSSTLKRMTCVITVRDQGSESSFVVSKGAPEVIEKLLKKVPDDYRSTYMKYSMQGFRVLALSIKPYDERNPRTEDIRGKDRTVIEGEQSFCGFLVLESPLKPESLKTIRELNESAHRVVMITGDHILTACEVARLLEITGKKIYVLQPAVGREGLEYQSLDGSDKMSFDIRKSLSVSEKYDICVSGDALDALIRDHGGNVLDKLCQGFICLVKVFARVSPKHKEIILTSMKTLGFTTLMCGDGTNDVGALKQAHAGVALIEGLSDTKQANSHIAKPGHTKKTVQQNLVNQVKRDQQMQALENASVEGNTIDEKLAARQKQMDELMKALEESDVPMVQLGDASIAAPFTSKIANISCCADILKQGRCTLVATMQMYKILALNCLITAYSMSVLYLDGVKLGDVQATCFGIVMAAMYLGLSHSKPVNKLSKQRPHDSVFSWYMFCSIGGQFLVHLTTMILASQWAHPHTPTDDEHRNPDGDFKINVLNTVVFLTQASMTISTFAANYQGRPFMVNLNENTMMYRLVVGSLLAIFAAAMNWLEPLTDMLELAPLPNEEFRANLVFLMAVDFVLVLAIERVLSKVFARDADENQFKLKLE